MFLFSFKYISTSRNVMDVTIIFILSIFKKKRITFFLTFSHATTKRKFHFLLFSYSHPFDRSEKRLLPFQFLSENALNFHPLHLNSFSTFNGLDWFANLLRFCSLSLFFPSIFFCRTLWSSLIFVLVYIYLFIHLYCLFPTTIGLIFNP